MRKAVLTAVNPVAAASELRLRDFTATSMARTMAHTEQMTEWTDEHFKNAVARSS